MKLSDWIIKTLNAHSLPLNLSGNDTPSDSGGAERMSVRSPQSHDVVELRERVQAAEKVGITAAQDICATQLHTSRRSWQQWERGERKMHPAFWVLANLMLSSDEPF